MRKEWNPLNQDYRMKKTVAEVEKCQFNNWVFISSYRFGSLFIQIAPRKFITHRMMKIWWEKKEFHAQQIIARRKEKKRRTLTPLNNSEEPTNKKKNRLLNLRTEHKWFKAIFLFFFFPSGLFSCFQRIWLFNRFLFRNDSNCSRFTTRLRSTEHV